MVAACILQDLVGTVETHGPAVNQRAGKCGRFVALQPATGVGQQGKACGVGLGKTIAAKPLDLFEDQLGELRRIAVFLHPGSQAQLVRFKPTVAFPGRHGATQLVGLPGAVVGGNNGDLHHLLLEQRHPKRALQHLAQLLGRIGFKLFTVSSPQIRMHHATLDRPGSHDRYLNDKVIELFGLEPGQHRHLRPGLDLEHPDRIRTANHFVGLGVFSRHRGQAQVEVAVATQQVKTAANGTEHAQRQDIDLEQTDRIQVVLVPLNDGALGHGRVLHRHQGVEWLLGNDKATRMLGQVPGKADQLSGEAEHPTQHRAFGVETAFAQAVQWRRLIAPVAATIGQGVDLVRRQPQRLGHVTHRSGSVIRADHCGQGCTGATVALKHVLQDFFATFVFEIDVDVWRFVTLLGKETLEQHVHACRVDLGDAQGKAHRRVGRRAASLAENALASGERDDVLHGEEITFITQLGDQAQFLVDQLPNLVTRTFGPTLANPALGQYPQPRDPAVALWHKFTWVLVAQLAQVEGATPGDPDCFVEQGLGIERVQCIETAQVPLAIGVQA